MRPHRIHGASCLKGASKASQKVPRPLRGHVRTMRPSTKPTLISLTRKRLLSRLAHWRLVALPSTRCFTSPVLIGGLASYARQITTHMKKTSWAKNEAHLAWIALFSRNQCLDYLGFYRARRREPPAARKRLGICHCQPHATLIAGTTEPLSLLWRRPVTKSPGLSGPLLDRYRPSGWTYTGLDHCTEFSWSRGTTPVQWRRRCVD